MEDKQLEKAKREVEEALKLIEDMESALGEETSSKDVIKEKFTSLSKKLQDLENILKVEGIL